MRQFEGPQQDLVERCRGRHPHRNRRLAQDRGTDCGAEEFAAFEKHMADKLKSTGTPTGNGEIPGGVPLALDSTMKMGKVNIPGMAPEQAAKINEMMAKRPPVTTSTTVESAKRVARDMIRETSARTKGAARGRAPRFRLGTDCTRPAADFLGERWNRPRSQGAVMTRTGGDVRINEKVRGRKAP